ncbi:MAG: tetratricopeptide repeat protein [Panacagrimonas sp.]
MKSGPNVLAGVALFLAMMTSGCVSESIRQIDRTVAEEIPVDDPATQRKVHTDLIRQMLGQEQFYAALAHIEAQVRESGSTDELRVLEAQARRKLKQPEQAQAIYRDLLRTSYVAEAYHGLGLISAATDLKTAVWQLQQAVKRQPANAEMRNDLGYALMVANRYPEALTELATAVELEAGGGSGKARNNLVLLMLVTRDEAAVKRLVQQSGMSDATLDGLRRQALTLSRKPALPAAVPRKS